MLGVIEDPIDEAARARFEGDVLEDQAHFLRRVERVDLADAPQPDDLEKQVGGGVQEPDQGKGDDVEDAQGNRGPQRHRLRALDRERLGGELAHDGVEEGDEHEGGGNGGTVSHLPRPEQGLEHPGEHRLADPAQR